MGEELSLKEYCDKHNIKLQNVLFIGNDINGYKDKDVELFLNKYWEKKYPKPFNDK